LIGSHSPPRVAFFGPSKLPFLITLVNPIWVEYH
jgi:hypothetical protein